MCVHNALMFDLGHKYTGQVATVVGWTEAPLPDGETSATCRPRKAGLPVLSYSDCVATAFDPAYVSADKGCVGIIGTRSIVCNVRIFNDSNHRI